MYGSDVLLGLRDTASPDLGRKKLVVEFSSPNIAIEFQRKHLRSTIIGSFISNLYKSMGWDVTKINYLGDWGAHIGLLGAGWERYGSEEQLEADPITHLLEVNHNVEEKFILADYKRKKIRDRGGDPVEFESKGVFAERNRFVKRLEDGEEKAVNFWKRVRETNIENYIKLYASLNITFDEYSGESLVSPVTMEEVEEILKSKQIYEHSDGSWYINLNKYKEPNEQRRGWAIIRNRVGTTTYLLRELAAVLERYRKYRFDKMIYVVGDQHTTHFPLVDKILKLMGMEDLASKLQWVSFNEGSQAAKQIGEGKGHILGGFFNQYQTAMEESLKENPEKASQLGDTDEETLEAIGTTGLLAQELSARRADNHAFDIGQMTSFVEGTGPDLQYWYAKLCSVISPYHATLDLADEDYASVEGEEQSNLLRYLIQYPDITHTAFATLESAGIMTYLSSVTAQLSACLGEEETSPTPAQIMLYDATRRVLENGMKVLGITPATK
jgi:arginyl-tRNA synthetase